MLFHGQGCIHLHIHPIKIVTMYTDGNISIATSSAVCRENRYSHVIF